MVLHHVGLLVNKPPARPGCPLLSLPTTATQLFAEAVPRFIGDPSLVYRIASSLSWEAHSDSYDS